GFRIELGEIEAILGQHPTVRQAVVVARDDQTGDKHLVAYLVPSPETSFVIRELREFLQRQLPDYMMPSLFTELDALPLTPNGKVDRNALPPPDFTLQSSELDRSLPTPIAELLAGIWSKTLGREKINIQDNFFELGGHSLLATLVISQVRQVFQVELPLRSLFESPTVAKLAQVIEAATQAGLGVDAPPIEQRSNSAPLSFAQQRMWFLAQLEPENPFYNLPIAVALQGELYLGALEQTFHEILCRHEALRTHFETREGHPIAITTPATAFQMSLVDLSELTETRQDAEVQQLIFAEAQQPFDLTCDLLLRVKLLCLAEHQHILLLTLHHIAADGWSFGILINEVTGLYKAFCEKRSSPLPDLPIQYGDFAAWQRQWLQGDVLQTQMSYWRAQLQDAPVLLELPTDRSRPAIQSYQGSSHSFEISPELSLALNQLSQQSGCTLFMTLLAVFTILLGRYSNSEDIVVGTPIANRNRTEVENLIGLFVNTLVLRIDLSSDPSVEELLRRVREVALGAYAHQNLPFEQLVEALQPQRSLSHTPLFQVMFVLQNDPLPEVELPNLRVTLIESTNGTTQFDLTLSMAETAQGLVGTLEYNCDLFEKNTIARMAEHYLTLLQSTVTNSSQCLSKSSLLTPAETHQLLVAWNATQTEYHQNQCIHHLFENQVKQTPNAIAVQASGGITAIFADQQFSYQELNVKANQLAHYLNRLGVKPEVTVGICVVRSLEMLVGMLGILKAGGAYLPLDPSYPQERLAFMLQDAQVSLIVTQQSLLNQLPDHQAQVICLDTDWSTIAQERQENLVHPSNPDQLAYLIYTSGSTGRPKGVMIQHRALVNYTEAIVSAYELKPSDRILQFASINFDVAGEEIFSCLVQGATLVLRTDEMLNSVPAFLQQVQTLELTVLNLPTAFWHQVTSELAAAPVDIPDALRLVIIGGERALPDRLQAWHQCMNQGVNQHVRLINCYGPTETTIGATLCDLSASIKASDREVSIGKPIQNVQAYVLDAHLQPVAIGVPGELYIGGAGVARGYLNRPDLTAEKFIPNPFAQPFTPQAQTDTDTFPSLSSRLYKTGDLVLYRSDGNLEYLGRIDAQVKIRGFRIELGEIEAVLSQHPAVRETVVVDREMESGDKRLVAYVVTDVVTEWQPAPSISDLRQFLQEKLPSYMVPVAFVLLNALPLTPNGKVDRQSLPDPDLSTPALDTVFVAPRTAIETTFAEIWTQVLGVKQVGIHDNFFELGGDSILSIQVVARANQACLQLTPKQMFEHQTIAELAAVTMTKQGVQVEQGLVTGSVFLTPIQHWFFEQNLPDPHHFNQAMLLQVPSNLNLDQVEQALQRLLVHHDALRLRFEQTESGWQQIHASPDPEMLLFRWNFSSLTEAEQKTALVAATTEIQTSLTLSSGVLMRAGFFNLGEHQPARLLLVIHHLVVDGISWRILIEDLQSLYQQLSQGEAVQLPSKTLSFKQWSQMLREYSRSDALQQEKDYWLTQQPFTPLPVDFPKGENTVASAHEIVSTLSFQDTQALLKDVPKAYHTEINDVLLTALVQAFAQWTNQRTLLIDLEGHGREDIAAPVNVSRTVGWFTTVFPVHLNLAAAANPGDALKTIKEQLRSIPNRGIGYGVLRYSSEDQEFTKTLRTLPHAEVIFNYLGQFDPTLAGSSLFRLVQEPSGSTQSLRGKRSHLLEINGWVTDGQLQLRWSYSQAVHRSSTIEALAQRLLQSLGSLISHCQSSDTAGYTPSDFSEANLSQQALDRFLAKINSRN
nr:amino acid adenylation domain-containing protein [Aphanocapsa sp. GSE-SYN-MK-11-07L]